VTAAAVVRFLVWDPVAHENYRSLDLYASGPDSTAFEEFLAGIEAGSVILPEKIRDKNLYGSPHSFDYFIQKYGHRNALGLTIESALTPAVSYAWLASGMPQIFQWGMEATWNRRLYRNADADEARRGLPAYLRRSGVDYVLGRTPAAFAYLREHFALAFAANPDNPSAGIFAFHIPDSREAFRVAGTRPLGYLSLASLRSGSDNAPLFEGRRITREFLLHANQLRLRPLLRDAPTIINLDPHYRRALAAGDIKTIFANLSGLILMHSGPELMPSEMSHSLARAAGVPLILVNFQRTAPDPGPTRYLYTILRVPSRATPRDGVFSALVDRPGVRLDAGDFSHRGFRLKIPEAAPTDPVAVEIGLSHFPDWRVSAVDPRPGDSRLPPRETTADSERIYQTDSNQMLVFAPPGRSLDFRFRASFARTLTVILYLVSLGLLGIGAYRFVLRLRRR
ncbi:MAG: hypothetical protein RIF32_00650, partial [Leptospirales bacterium]